MVPCPHTLRVLALLEDSLGDEPLEDHLASCPECQHAVGQAAGELHLPGTPLQGEEPSQTLLARLRSLSHPPADPKPDIPGLEVLEVIGQGASSVVYRARQRALNRIVALKVLNASFVLQPDGLERTRRGIEVLASIDHPGMVRILHAGQHGEVYFGVLEFASGGSLAQRLRGQPWPAAEAARLVRDLADAVQVLHERGHVHRDIKPANVLLWEGNAGEVVQAKLGDFGLARPIEGPELTARGMVLGTPGAMAPEQAAGRGELGPGVDIWALGVLLYELLTGKPPFQAESTTELLGRTAHASPIPPRKLIAGIPADLEWICLTCLRKDPADRYSSARQLSEDLAAYLEGKSLPSRPGNWRDRVRGRIWQHAMLLIGGAILVGLLAVLLGIGTFALRAQESLHRLRLEVASERLERGDRQGAARILERCERRDAEWHALRQRCLAE